ncbi:MULTISPECIES: NAD(P)/FAD-dependent oxidoreductase [Hydrogenophaga]|uniref:FAD-dependent pyridine nucleotide-disulfide oxidoreductase n=1 Tax=Hydrogenophaga intermedia TaxID=65786 RepID=A0A1L1PXL5_HYDIT|nr:MULTISPECIES: FAD-dependent oxidoreductase [Hydrogenophaga]AOS81957.1 pyridine nucleotide-disulfide oxidoreductase [Hydrogenophaga sp. PBC]TMU78401.1 pyridine nucleotide-disulfide oxidoreductase [Hydrogenophaga intermedia]CDN89371.1 FAD-dependent pyridine nucleotide-disulfide oxidoreductase [Hydrogenophaga intermedia]
MTRTEKNAPLVIIGASYAGLQLASSARELGFEEDILIVGDEPHPPYQRPPLSKGLLTGKATVDQLWLRSPEFYAQKRIELCLGRRVTALDPGARRLTLDDGTVLEHGWLALTTGARARALPLPGAELDGVLPLRTLDDALRVAEAAASARAVCVIGGGFIGLEVAAALRTRGAEVSVIETQPRLLARSMPALMSAFVENAHRQRGVEVLTGRGVRGLVGAHGRVAAVELADGQRIDCDLVVLGVGVWPNGELARDAGLTVDNGIVTDPLGRTSAERVLAAGDVAAVASMPGAPRVRHESIQAATDGARAAASLLVDKPRPNTAVPWFWSDQFELKFQMAGVAREGDEAVVRGEPDSARFSVFYLRDGAIAAAHSVNRPGEHLLSRQLIAAGARLAPETLADPDSDLKAALAAMVTPAAA